MGSKKKSGSFSNPGKHSAEARNKEQKRIEKEEKKKERAEEKIKLKEEKKINKEKAREEKNKEDSSIVINLQEIDRKKLEKKVKEKKQEEKSKKKFEKVEQKEKRKEEKVEKREQKKKDKKEEIKVKEEKEERREKGENKSEDNISYFEKFKTKKLNKKRIIALIFISIIAIIIISLFAAYLTINDFRNFVDTEILRKVKTSENLFSIEVNNDEKHTNKYKENNSIFAYNDKICILKNNILTIYNSQGTEQKEIEIDITNPIIETDGEMIAIAEEYGNKVCMISAKNLLWKKQIEGQISRININKNGYVSIVVTGTSYKSVIYLFDSTGDEVFKYYISNTMVVDTSISEDNKYLAYAEVDSSGALIQSNIKVISIDKIKKNEKDSIVYVHEAEPDKLITQIKYQDSRLVCLYNDSIDVLKNNGENSTLVKFDEADGRCIYADINLSNKAVIVYEKDQEDGKSQIVVNLFDSLTKNEKLYAIEGSAKEIDCNGKDKIAVNLGSEIYVINTNGFLVKKYISDREIPRVIISEGITGIIYNTEILLMNI